MALYNVQRNDDVKPGEFASALVIAGGTALARSLVAGRFGVRKNGSNVTATKVDVTSAVGILTTEFDERDPAPVYDVHETVTPEFTD